MLISGLLGFGCDGQGDRYAETLADVKPAFPVHVETDGSAVFDEESAVREAFIAETGVKD